MRFSQAYKIALRGLSANKSRSALTILGIVIGITAIILVMSVGQGAQDLILSQVQGLGSKTIAVLPGREPTGPSDFGQLFSDSLKEKDLTALRRKENVPTLADVMPVVFGSETASWGSETYRVTIIGATPKVVAIFDLDIDQGQIFNDEDVRGRADVAIIGAKVKEELFGTADPIGQKIRVKDRSLRVIGTIPRKGQVSFFNFDELIAMPYTTAQQYIFGIKHFHRLIVEASSEETVPQTAQDVMLTLRASHNITDPEKDDFYIETQADLVERIGTITSILTVLLVSIAAISLVVGGIGIMNIMLVSVTERTREIGLRKAIGATEKDILTQFLMEAVLLTALGGLIGVTLGALLGFLVSVVLTNVLHLGWVYSFPVTAALMGLGVASAVGLVFGIYPARKAALKDPIQALQYE